MSAGIYSKVLCDCIEVNFLLTFSVAANDDKTTTSLSARTALALAIRGLVCLSIHHPCEHVLFNPPFPYLPRLPKLHQGTGKALERTR